MAGCIAIWWRPRLAVFKRSPHPHNTTGTLVFARTAAVPNSGRPMAARPLNAASIGRPKSQLLYPPCAPYISLHTGRPAWRLSAGQASGSGATSAPVSTVTSDAASSNGGPSKSISGPQPSATPVGDLASVPQLGETAGMCKGGCMARFSSTQWEHPCALLRHLTLVMPCRTLATMRACLVPLRAMSSSWNCHMQPHPAWCAGMRCNAHPLRSAPAESSAQSS